MRIRVETENTVQKPGMAVADDRRGDDAESGAVLSLRDGPALPPHEHDRDGVAGEPLADAAELAQLRRASAAINGDADAVRGLWAEHRRWVAGVLLAHKPKWADLDDLLQDVALTMVRKVHEVRDPAALRPWLRTVAMNAAYLAGRKGQRSARTASLTGEDGSLRFEPSTKPGEPEESSRTEGGRLMALAGELPDGYREPLLLKAIQGLSYREIGRILGLPETTIETRIARGRRMLRELASKET